MRFEQDLLRGSERRLWELIQERTKPGADVDEIDRRIWDLFGEDWAIMFTDLAGFSRQTASFGIIHFLQVIFEHKQLLLPIIADHDGILVKSEADSFLLLFRRARRALDCAIEMQRACRNASERRVAEEQILLCVGMGAGRILRIGDHEVWGAEVNAASKLGEDTAAAHEILITHAAREQCGEVDGVQFTDLAVQVPGSGRNYRVVYER
jgi:class 3 adenylate cyclase